MERAKAIAREIVGLVPKLLRGLRAGFIGNEQLSTSQLVILMRIHEQKISRAGILSREMHVSASTITGLIEPGKRSFPAKCFFMSVHVLMDEVNTDAGTVCL